MPLYALTGFFVGIVGGVPFVLVRAFSAPIRYSGLSFSYNVGYALSGGLTPVAVPLLLGHQPAGACVLCHRSLRLGIRDRSLAAAQGDPPGN